MISDAINVAETIIGSGLATPVPSLPNVPTVGRRTCILRDTLLIALTDTRGISATKGEHVDELEWNYHPSIGYFLRDPHMPRDLMPQAVRLAV